MRLAGLAAVLLLTLAACQSDPAQPAPTESAMFGPRAMVLHPIFTQIRDFNGDGVPDGIEADVEFTDQFGDPTKASGSILFELYAYRRDYPDPRGERICPPWLGQILLKSQQRRRWDRTSRGYIFALSAPMVSATANYILTATFEPPGGPTDAAPRLFAQTVIEGKKKDKSSHSRMPTSLFPTTDESSPDQNAAPGDTGPGDAAPGSSSDNPGGAATAPDDTAPDESQPGEAPAATQPTGMPPSRPPGP